MLSWFYSKFEADASDLLENHEKNVFLLVEAVSESWTKDSIDIVTTITSLQMVKGWVNMLLNI